MTISSHHLHHKPPTRRFLTINRASHHNNHHTTPTQPTLFIPQCCNLPIQLLRSDRNNNQGRAERMVLIGSYEAFIREQNGSNINRKRPIPMTRYVMDMMDALNPQMDTSQYRYWIKMKYLLCELIVEGEEIHLTSVTVHTNWIHSKNI